MIIPVGQTYTVKEDHLIDYYRIDIRAFGIYQNNHVTVPAAYQHIMPLQYKFDNQLLLKKDSTLTLNRFHHNSKHSIVELTLSDQYLLHEYPFSHPPRSGYYNKLWFMIDDLNNIPVK